MKKVVLDKRHLKMMKFSQSRLLLNSTEAQTYGKNKSDSWQSLTETLRSFKEVVEGSGKNKADFNVLAEISNKEDFKYLL
jgi:hypothetical protein